jgi:hypothetical protein
VDARPSLAVDLVRLAGIVANTTSSGLHFAGSFQRKGVSGPAFKMFAILSLAAETSYACRCLQSAGIFGHDLRLSKA